MTIASRSWTAGAAGIKQRSSRILRALEDGLYSLSDGLGSLAERISPPKPPTKTLFDPDLLRNTELRAPYPLEMHLLYHHSNWEGFHDSEVCAFADVAEMDMALVRRGEMIGPLIFEEPGHERVDASQRRVSWPAWVEEDGLRLISCDAKVVLLVHGFGEFHPLADSSALRSQGVLLMTGAGLPRAPARRLLHRISTQFEIPVCVLGDNDTWGYFAFSLLKRGCLDPAGSCPYLAVDDVRYLGLLAGEGSHSCRRGWEPRFDLRLRHLKRYECFASEPWQAELQRFETEHHAASLSEYIAELGAERFVEEYLEPKLEHQGWLR